MRRLMAIGLLGLALSGCATSGGWWAWWESADNELVGVVAIELPAMCSRLVQVRSDVALIRPSYETVLAQDCETWDGMGDAVVWWVLVDGQNVNVSGVDSLSGVDAQRRTKPTDTQAEPIAEAVQNFATASASIRTPSESLRAFVAKAKSRPGMPIRIIGHTDSRGTAPYNLQLGQRRAEAVAKWLRRQGISADRLTIESMGPNQPLGDNGTVAGRAINRRAQATLTLVVKGEGT